MKKAPFEFNEANNYYWNRQGKRHFWGIRGKDYGLLQSTPQNRDFTANNQLEFLKHKHINLNRNQYEERLQYERYERHRNKQYEKVDNVQMKEPRNPYPSEQRGIQMRIRTQPVQEEQLQGRYKANNSEQKRRHLSLMSRNIQISNSQTPKIDPSKRFSTIDCAEEKEKHQQQNYKKMHKRVNTEVSLKDNQIQKYRERIVKVLKRDRKNNPTFCNSLAYPLHCYRYVQ